MKPLISLYLVLLRLVQGISFRYYIDPTGTCSTPFCPGDSTTPFNNLWAAMTSAVMNSKTQVDFLLINRAYSPHYMFLNQGGVVPLSAQLALTGSFSIQPLNCTDSQAQSDFNLQGNCYLPGEVAKILTKDENFQLVITGSLSINFIQFDGSEDIAKYNSPSSALNSCIQQRVQCCASGTKMSGVQTSVACYGNAQVNINSPGSGFLNLLGTSTLSLLGSSFQNFNFLTLPSLFNIAPLASGTLIMAGTTIKNFFFQFGIIQASFAGVGVSMTGCQFLGYNKNNFTNSFIPLWGNFSVVGHFGGNPVQSINVTGCSFGDMKLGDFYTILRSVQSSVPTVDVIQIVGNTFFNIQMERYATVFNFSGDSTVLLLENQFSNLQIGGNLANLTKNQQVVIQSFSVDSSTITGNAVIYSNWNGGFVMQNVSVMNSVFNSQSGSNLAGVLFHANSAPSGIDTVKIKNNKFLSSNNQIMTVTTPIAITNLDCSFNNFQAQPAPYAPLISLSNIGLLNNSIFSQNLGYFPKGISCSTVQPCTVYNTVVQGNWNIAGEFVNAFYLVIFNTSFLYNTIQNNLIITNNQFPNASGKTVLNAIGLQMIGNTVLGIAIVSYTTGYASFTACLFTRNNITGYMIQIKAVVKMNQVEVSFNKAGVFLDGSISNLNQLNFTGNEYYHQYPFLNMEILNQVTNFTNSIVDRNIVKNGAQAFLYFYCGTNFSNLVITNNQVNEGGSLFKQGKSGGSYNNIQISGNLLNTSTLQSILFYINDGLITFQNINFLENQIIGATAYMFYIVSYGDIIMDSAFIMTTFIQDGIFFQCAFDQITLSNVMVSNNLIKGKQAGFSSHCHVQGLKVLFTNNIFDDAAGIIGVQGNIFNLSQAQIMGNTMLKTAIFFNVFASTMTASYIEIAYNDLQESSVLLDIMTASSLQAGFLSFHDNKLSHNSIFILSEESLILLGGLNLTNNWKPVPDPQVITARPLYFIVLTRSLTFMKGVLGRNCTSFLLANEGTLSIEEAGFFEPAMLGDSRYFIQGILIKNLTLNNITIQPGQLGYPKKEEWLQFHSCNVWVNLLLIGGFGAEYGFLIKSMESSLVLSNVYVQGMTFGNLGPLFKIVQGNFTLTDSLFLSTNQILDAESCQTIHLQNVTISSIFDMNYGIYILSSQNILLNGVIFDLKSVQNSIITILEASVNVTITNSMLRNCVTRTGGIDIENSVETPSIMINGTLFQNLVGVSSGALTLIFSSPVILTVQTSIFLGNSALLDTAKGGRGGAIYFSALRNSGYLIVGNNFMNNFGNVSGGAVFVYGVPPAMVGNVFLGNLVMRGINNFASQPVKLITSNSGSTVRLLQTPISPTPNMTGQTSMTISQIGSGLPLSQQMTLVLLDMYDQVCADDDSSSLEIVIPAASGQVQPSIQSIQANLGVYNLTGISFTFSPGQNTSISFSSSAINAIQGLAITASQSINVDLQFRDCIQGEIVTENGACYSCPQGFASFDFNVVNTRQSCKECDSETTNCTGGSNVGPMPGAWRLSNTSNIFKKCPISEACLNYTNNKTGTFCADDYQGNLCNNCVEGFGKDFGGTECVPCLDHLMEFLIIAGIVLVNILTLGYSAYQNIKGKSKQEQEHLKQKSEMAKMSSVLMKNIISFFQLAQLILVNASVNWPGFLEGLTSIGGKIVAPKLSDDCFYTNLAKGQTLEIVYFKVLMTNLVPVALILVEILLWSLAWAIFRGKEFFKHHGLGYCILKTLIIIFYNFQVSEIQGNLSLLNCDNLYRDDDSLEFLQLDYDVPCWNKAHYTWLLSLGLPAALLWCILMPGFSFFAMKKERKNVNNHEYMSFLSDGFSEKKYFWEFVIMMRKFVLMFLATFLVNYQEIRQFVALLILLAAYVLQVKYRPFENAMLNQMEELGLVTLFILSATSLIFLNEKNTLYGFVFGFLAVLAAMAYLTIWIGAKWWSSRDKTKKNKLRLLLNKLKQKFLGWKNRHHKLDNKDTNQNETPDHNNEIKIVDMEISEIERIKTAKTEQKELETDAEFDPSRKRKRILKPQRSRTKDFSLAYPQKKSYQAERNTRKYERKLFTVKMN